MIRVFLNFSIVFVLSLNAEQSMFGAGDLNSPTPYGLTKAEKVIVKNKKTIKSNEKTLKNNKKKINKVDVKINDLEEKLNGLDSILESESIKLNKVYLNLNKHLTSYKYSSKVLQELISTIAEDAFPDAPQINNYTLNHTITNKGTNTTTIKKLFEAMLEDEEKVYLGIDKFPAQKALYLSVIKPAGIHKQQKDGTWRLSEPDNLNFAPVWNRIKKVLNEKTSLSFLVEILKKEPCN